jgi:CRP/FNR family transcriptional regulator, cyclic AMP receptor protein
MVTSSKQPPNLEQLRTHAATRTPYGFERVESCINCPHLGKYLFCNLPANGLEALDHLRSAAVYPKGAILFVEGETPRGVFLLCHGRAKLSTSSATGKTVILRIAEPGEVLGLTATVSGRGYEATAETLEPCEASFISRQNFLDFLRRVPEAALNAAQELSRHYHCACREVRSLGLSASAPAKMARVLLQFATQAPGHNDFHMRLTHEEISQIIGTSRETVTRVLADFKKRKVVRIKGAHVVIDNRAELETLAQ